VSNWYGKEWWDWSKFQKCPYGAKGSTGSVFLLWGDRLPGSPIYKWGNAHVRRSGSGRREAKRRTLMKVARKKARWKKH
jgi:hypothetical protein